MTRRDAQPSRFTNTDKGSSVATGYQQSVSRIDAAYIKRNIEGYKKYGFPQDLGKLAGMTDTQRESAAAAAVIAKWRAGQKPDKPTDPKPPGDGGGKPKPPGGGGGGNKPRPPGRPNPPGRPKPKPKPPGGGGHGGTRPKPKPPGGGGGHGGTKPPTKPPPPNKPKPPSEPRNPQPPKKPKPKPDPIILKPPPGGGPVKS